MGRAGSGRGVLSLTGCAGVEIYPPAPLRTPLTHPCFVADVSWCFCWPRSQDQKPLPGEQQNEQHPQHEQLHGAGDSQPEGCAFPLRLPAPSSAQVSATRGAQPQGSTQGTSDPAALETQAHGTVAVLGLLPHAGPFLSSPVVVRWSMRMEAAWVFLA